MDRSKVEQKVNVGSVTIGGNGVKILRKIKIRKTGNFISGKLTKQ